MLHFHLFSVIMKHGHINIHLTRLPLLFHASIQFLFFLIMNMTTFLFLKKNTLTFLGEVGVKYLQKKKIEGDFSKNEKR